MLHAGGDADADALEEEWAVENEVLAAEREQVVAADMPDGQRHATGLRQDGGRGGALDVPTKNEDEKQIERDVEHGRSQYETHGPHRVADAAQDGESAVEKDEEERAGGIDAEVPQGVGHHLGRRAGEPKEAVGTDDANDGEHRTGHRREEQTRREGTPHRLVITGAEALRDDDGDAAPHADGQRDDEVIDEERGRDGG